MPTVDVGIPSYQYGRFLEGCIRSALDQEGVAVRVLVVDNASTDGSADIARRLAAEDPRVTVRARARNLGPHASYNECVDWASGDYFLMLAADDMLVPGALKRAVAVLESHPRVVVAMGKVELVAGDQPPPPSGPIETDGGWRVESGHAFVRRCCRTVRMPCVSAGCLIRTAAQKRVGHYRPEIEHLDDFEVFLRLAVHGDVAVTPTVQARARIHEVNQAHNLRGTHAWNLEYEQMFASFFAHEGAALGDAERLKGLVRRRLGQQSYVSAVTHLLRGDFGGAATLAAYAARNAPMSFVVPPVAVLASRSPRISALAERFSLGLVR